MSGNRAAMVQGDGPHAPAAIVTSAGRRWASVAILLCFYILAHVDRALPSVLATSMKADLHLSDFQLGLLLGPAFGLLYALSALPMGMLADRIPVRGLLYAGVTFWSVACAMSGVATTYPHLLASRIGVGLGEATVSPSAFKLISTMFERRSAVMAMSVYGLGTPIGHGVGLILGGYLVTRILPLGSISVPAFGDLRAWQAAFMAAGLPGLAIALLALLLPRPAGRTMPLTAADGEGVAALLRAERRRVAPILATGALMSVVGSTMMAWTPAYIERTFGWSHLEVGSKLALLVVGGGISGNMLLGTCTRWLKRRGVADSQLRVAAGSCAIGLPCIIAGYSTSDVALFFMVMIPPFLVLAGFIGYSVDALHDIAPQRHHGAVAALYLMSINVLGPIIGPPAVGLMSDRLYSGPEATGHALVTLMSVCGVLLATLLTWALRRSARTAHPG